MESQRLSTNQSMILAIRNEDFSEIVKLAERREMLVLNVKNPEARASIARRWKLAVGTLSNVKRGRRKNMGELRRIIGEALYRDLGTELTRLAHEQQLLRQCGFGADSREIHEIQNVMQKVRAAYEALAG